jgi:hypothetical protein
LVGAVVEPAVIGCDSQIPQARQIPEHPTHIRGRGAAIRVHQHRGPWSGTHRLRPDQVETQGAFVYIFGPTLDVAGELLGVNKVPVGKLTGEDAPRESHQRAPAQDIA